MSDKSLKDKAIKVQGKDYVLVSDRVIYFNEKYENGSIRTRLLSSIDSEDIFIRAIVVPDTDKPMRYFVAHAQEKWGDGFVNKTSALENAETSAVGRALAMMGIGVIDSIASVDEINKAKNRNTTNTVNTIKSKYENMRDKVGLPIGQKQPLCPGCDAKMLPIKNRDGFDIWFCPEYKKCGSKPINITEVDMAGNIVGKKEELPKINF